jgi:hypothetical protein
MLGAEVWKDVVGCEGSYEISNHGRVRSLARTVQRRYRNGYRLQTVRAALLRPCFRTKYPTVTLIGRKSRSVHSLVLEAFVGPRPEGHEGLHGDGNRTNNHLSNLRWGTSKENKEDAIKHGVWTHGEMVGCAKLTDEAVRAIRASSETLEYFAQRFGVTIQAVSLARNYRTWKHVS